MKKYLLFFLVCVNTQLMSKPKKNSASEENKNKRVAAPCEREIEIINGINPSMLEYSYFGKHSPNKFVLSINGESLEPQKSKKIKITGDRLSVRYDYEFAKGLYKGSKIVDLSAEPTAKKITLGFSWKDPLRIRADHAQTESIKAVKKP